MFPTSTDRTVSSIMPSLKYISVRSCEYFAAASFARWRMRIAVHSGPARALIEAWALIKSFRRKDGGDNDPDGSGRNAKRGFHKEKRSNDTHESTSDPGARLYKKSDGQPARLCYMGHALMESLAGKWRIVAMPDYVEDYPDMMEPAYILFEAGGSGEFAFGCVTGQIFGSADGDHIAFSWTGNDEMDEAQGRRLGRNPARRVNHRRNLRPKRR